MATKPASKLKPEGWGDEDDKKKAAEAKDALPIEDRIATLESEHEELLEVLDRHGINLPSRST